MDTTNYQATQASFGTHSNTGGAVEHRAREKRAVHPYTGDDRADWRLDDARREDNTERALAILKGIAPRLGQLQAEMRCGAGIFTKAIKEVGGRNGLALGDEGLLSTWAELQPLMREAFDVRAAELAVPHMIAARDAIAAELECRRQAPENFSRGHLLDFVCWKAEECAEATDLPTAEIFDDLASAAGLTDDELNKQRFSPEEIIADFDLRFDTVVAEAQAAGTPCDRESLLLKEFEWRHREGTWRERRIESIDYERIIWRKDRAWSVVEGSPRLLWDPFYGEDIRAPISAAAFRLGDAAKLPRREWLYGTTLIRKFISVTVAPGGVGKSSLTIVEALAMVTGRPLLGVQLPAGPLRVWLWNGEDPLDELSRRIHAACIQHGLDEAAIGNRLFVNSGRDMGLVVMREVKKEVVTVEPVVEAVIAEIEAKKIDVLIVDPFVTTHEVSENDNTAMNRVAVLWGQIANRTGCAIMLVHHAKKMQGAEVNAEDARGASALNGAARMVRTLNAMTKDEADRFGVNPDERFSHIRIGDANGKANLTRRSGRDVWFRIANVALGNGGGDLDPGDEVGVVESWAPPSAKDRSALTSDRIAAVQVEVRNGEYRLNERSPQWVGNAVSRALDLDPDELGAKRRLKCVIDRLIADGHLAVAKRLDAARKMKDFVEVGSGTMEQP